MADTTRSIKGATDVELNGILSQLRREREVLRMLQELDAKSKSNPNGTYPSYNFLEALSTETPVNNNKSIKQMTDDELEIFLSRLRNENEVVSIIEEIQRINNPPKVDANGNYIDMKMYEGIDLNTPVRDLYHFGIPGMRWGVRRGSKSTPKGSSDYLESRSLKKKGVKNLSTAELKTLTTRTQLETNYKNLNPSVVKKGMSAGKAILAGMATITTVYAFAKSPPGQFIIDKSSKLVSKVLRKTAGG